MTDMMSREEAGYEVLRLLAHDPSGPNTRAQQLGRLAALEVLLGLVVADLAERRQVDPAEFIAQFRPRTHDSGKLAEFGEGFDGVTSRVLMNVRTIQRLLDNPDA